MKSTTSKSPAAAAKGKTPPNAVPPSRPRPAVKRTRAAAPPVKAPPTKQAAAASHAARSVQAGSPPHAATGPLPAGQGLREADRPTTPAPKVAAHAGAAALPSAAAASPAPAKPKLKLVRDSFTMPQSDFSLIQVLKERSLDLKRPVKKSELLRAGLHVLAALDSVRLQAALGALEPLKPGRPKKFPS